jgi:hypothetical protein
MIEIQKKQKTVRFAENIHERENSIHSLLKIHTHGIDNFNLCVAIKVRELRITQQHSQRLLILRHASKCVTKEGHCRTPLCRTTKPLWKHVMNCVNNTCSVADCFSSRYALKHYSKCVDMFCAICEPTRSAFKANHERKLEMCRGAECLSSLRNPVESELSVEHKE